MTEDKVEDHGRSSNEIKDYNALRRGHLHEHMEEIGWYVGVESEVKRL